MGADPRLPALPDKPTLIDFMKHRFASTNHLLQSATLALKNGHDEKVVLACLLHDIGVVGFIRCDHGYWGAQMIEPYVDEEVSWAIRMHQALRFFPDLSVGYEYPEMYIKHFGADYKPEPYIVAEYERARNHKWYMTSRLITVNDVYSFDPNAKVNLDDFVDIIGRHFRQPKEGLGFDNSPSAHMWRTLNWPTRFSIVIPGRGLCPRARIDNHRSANMDSGSSLRSAWNDGGHEDRRRPAVRPQRARPAEFLYRPFGAAAQSGAADARARTICQ